MDQSVYQLGTHLGTAVGIVVVVGIYVLAILALTCSVIWQKVVAAIGLGFHGQILGGCRRVCTSTSAGTTRVQQISPVNMAAIVIGTETRAADGIWLRSAASAQTYTSAAASWRDDSKSNILSVEVTTP